ncbi:hypothetical protein [Azospirillum thermophilum]|uniref:Uncharacterized protein n=1 Tax=Azospirillum thermophilum TaxID=2202148 RepID=A0A2S2CRZ3_9PROT|nr:hypothetical protein [Azospirillum thermophilum]AWK87195.1 hypothetical protein DEW08_14050 [Azospirillum thermophilum]
MKREYDRDRLRRVAAALGDSHLYDKHHTGEFIAMRLSDSLADLPGFDAERVQDTLMRLAEAALRADEDGRA